MMIVVRWGVRCVIAGYGVGGTSGRDAFAFRRTRLTRGQETVDGNILISAMQECGGAGCRQTRLLST